MPTALSRVYDDFANFVAFLAALRLQEKLKTELTIHSASTPAQAVGANR